MDYNRQKLQSELEKLNPWWQGNWQPNNLIPRPGYTQTILNRADQSIDILTGARRVGKTMIMMDIVRELLQHHQPAQIFYVTAELPVIAGISISELWQLYQQLHPPKSKQINYWLIDEIQEIGNWQSEIKYLYDQKKIKLFITGSSSLILNQKSAKLTGRFILTHVFPLNFNEYLAFTNQSLNENIDQRKFEWLKKAVASVRDYLSNLSEITRHISFYFSEQVSPEDEKARQVLDEEQVPQTLKFIRDKLGEMKEIGEEETRKFLKGVTKDLGLSGKKVYLPLRVALTGSTEGPELYQVIPILGRDKAIVRLEKALSWIKS